MKQLQYVFGVVLVSIIFAGCRTDNSKLLKGSIIDEQTALTFRKAFLNYPGKGYHIPKAFMFEKIEFDALWDMSGVDGIRLYPAINTHDDEDDDSLTLIMVPVNGDNQRDNFSGYLFEYAQLCPSICNCSGAGTYTAPTEASLDYIIPTSWCISKQTIQDVITAAEETGTVSGIRFYTAQKEDGTMDLTIIATHYNDSSDYYQDIGEVRIENAAAACLNGDGCCDKDSKLYNPTGKEKGKKK